MAWKRSVHNNQAGSIRRGHVREFLLPSSRASSVSASLKVVHIKNTPLQKDFADDIHAFISAQGDGFPSQLEPFITNGMLYLHAHAHPRCVLSVSMHPWVEPGTIVLNDVHLVNCKVCTDDVHEFSVYQGEQFVYDARAGAIGDTSVRSGGNIIPVLSGVVLSIRRRHLEDSCDTNAVEIDADLLTKLAGKKLHMSIVSLDEVFALTVGGVDLVCRVSEVTSELAGTSQGDDGDEGSDDNQDDDGEDSDDYRGLCDAGTKVFVQCENKSQRISLINAPAQDARRQRRDLVDVLTNDEEVFPVARRLLRPCIALTAVVQQGYGKYKVGSEEQRNSVRVDLDACTFDRVLLYLEHEARGEEFTFDPLLTNELLSAAELLGISGLRDLCLKKLGNFQDRVRKTPIRLDEVIVKNQAGSDAAEASLDGKRTITWLILNGMVLDISRWLEEHPGGSSIIPRQALNIDSTLFFELYHASRQSFLYLKEFYIGELFVDDLSRLPPSSESPSAAFLEELKRSTSWRLRPEDLTLTVATHLGAKAAHS